MPSTREQGQDVLLLIDNIIPIRAAGYEVSAPLRGRMPHRWIPPTDRRRENEMASSRRSITSTREGSVTSSQHLKSRRTTSPDPERPRLFAH